jgi:hypothetical protein
MPTFWGIFSLLHLMAWILVVVNPENDGIIFPLSTTLHPATNLTTTIFTSWCLPNTHLVLFFFWKVILYIKVYYEMMFIYRKSIWWCLFIICVTWFIYRTLTLWGLLIIICITSCSFIGHYLVLFVHKLYYIFHLSDVNLLVFVDTLCYIVFIYMTSVS